MTVDLIDDPNPPRRLDFLAALPRAGAYPCQGGCGSSLVLPGRCDACAARRDDADRAKRLRLWERTIPELFRDVSWDALPGLRRVKLHAPDLVAVRRQLERKPRGVIFGPGGSGKTTIAVAHLRAAVEAEPDLRVRLVSAEHLIRVETPDGGVTPMALAMSAEVLVLDDFGAPLLGAKPDTGLNAMRIGPESALLAERFDRRLRTLITTGLEPDQVVAHYGDRIKRRVYEDAAVIRLGGAL